MFHEIKLHESLYRNNVNKSRPCIRAVNSSDFYLVNFGQKLREKNQEPRLLLTFLRYLGSKRSLISKAPHGEP